MSYGPTYAQDAERLRAVQELERKRSADDRLLQLLPWCSQSPLVAGASDRDVRASERYEDTPSLFREDSIVLLPEPIKEQLFSILSSVIDSWHVAYFRPCFSLNSTHVKKATPAMPCGVCFLC
jgi:hypothetical protein